MLFSTEFSIKRNKDDDWFDPILSMDTKLFIDPFLIFESEHNFFQDSHQKTIDFFNQAFEIGSVTNPTKKDVRYRNLLKMMRFPEVEEVCLGYASRGTGGAGSGGGFSKVIVNSIFESIELGITNFDRFEEIGLFNEGFGCDRISDMTATLLKKELIEYTKEICKRNNVPTKQIKITQFNYNLRYKRWDDKIIELPINPYTNKAIILVPAMFLRELPTLSAEEFYNFCWANKNEELRDQYGIEIKSQINKSEIIRIARQNRIWVKEYEDYLIKNGSKPYNIELDPKGYYSWVQETSIYVKDNPTVFTIPTNHKTFTEFSKEIIGEFEQFIENNSGYKLLWDENGLRARSEEAVQLLFTGIVKHYTRANNIDLSREVNLGRGPVDFKFSSGYENRVLIEVKLAKNTKFWNGLEKQLVKYLEVEEIKNGFFLVICYNENDLKKIKDIEKKAKDIGQENGVNLEVIIIDASYGKPSASIL